MRFKMHKQKMLFLWGQLDVASQLKDGDVVEGRTHNQAELRFICRPVGAKFYSCCPTIHI